MNSLRGFFLGCPIWITHHIVSQNWKSSPKSAKIGLSKFQTYLNTEENLDSYELSSALTINKHSSLGSKMVHSELHIFLSSSIPGGENRRRLHGGGRMKRSPRSQCTYGRYACGMLASWFFYGGLTWCFLMDGVETDMLVTGFFSCGSEDHEIDQFFSWFFFR